MTVRSLMFAALVSACALAPMTACSSTDDASSDDDLSKKKDAGYTDSGALHGGAKDAAAGDSGTRDGGAAVAPAQLNDVAILFPLAKTAAEFKAGYLSASAAGAGGALLPQNVYDAIGQVTGSAGSSGVGGTADAAYADLRVVAMRIDFCFAALKPDLHGAGCQNQLRLVLQEVTSNGGATSTFDSAIHAFYSLSRADLAEVTREIIALRVANSKGERLGALAAHPIMVSQSLTGAMASGVRAIILKFAGKSNLTRTTKLSMTNTGFNWSFEGFDIKDATTPTIARMPIPSVPASTKSQLFFRGSGAKMTGSTTPETSSADDLMPLANSTTTNGLTPAKQQAAYDALLRVENPAHHSPDTIDCVSCHLANPAAKMIAEPELKLSRAGNANNFSPDGVWVLPSEMTSTFPMDNWLNVHAFSYRGTEAGFNPRTVKQAAAIMQYMNANVLK